MTTHSSILAWRITFYNYHFIVVMVSMFKIYSHSSFQIYNTMVTMVTMKKKKYYFLSRIRLFVTPMDCSMTNSSVYGILQARKLEWVVIPSSTGFS